MNTGLPENIVTLPKTGLTAKTLIWSVIAALLFGTLIGWAFTRVFLPDTQPLTEQPYSVVEVQTGSVGESTPATVVVNWPTSLAATNSATGVVTSIDITPGQKVDSNQKLFSVNMRPTVAAIGKIPTFGPLSLGEEGPAVAQLKDFLTQIGHLSANKSTKFDSATEIAVKAWQKTHGYRADGVIQEGDIIWFPKLPAPVLLGNEIALGQRITTGSGEIRYVSATPQIELALTVAQAAHATVGTKVSVPANGGTWEGIIKEHRSDPNNSNSLYAVVRTETDEPICGTQCSSLPVGEESYFTGEIVNVPVLSGLTVQSAAIRVWPDQKTYVITESGEEIPVTVKQSAKGFSLIEGIAEGSKVRIPAKAKKK